MPEVNIGIIGLGVVGSGVYKLLEEHRKNIENKSGVRINLRWACDLDKSKKEQLNIPEDIFTDSVRKVLDDDRVDLIVELIGGTTIAKDITFDAIARGKHVITANKALIATYGKSIFESVVENRVEFGFEGSVGGGIPIIKTLLEGLVGNEVYKIVGIVNGTTNFILTMMTKENIDFTRALKIAQEKGFAERDPTLDISGGDASHKITILASLAFKSWVELSEVFVEGIDRISINDIKYAGELGFVLKLLAIAERSDNGIIVKVHPSLVSSNNPLAFINWENNAIVVDSDYLGTSMYYGKGAGSKPTASAIISDIVDIAMRIQNKDNYNPSRYVFFKNIKQIPFGESISRFYFRFNVLDRPGMLAKIAGVLGKNNISIASVIQKESDEVGEYVPLVLMTHSAREKDVQKAISVIDEFPEIKERSIIIRVA